MAGKFITQVQAQHVAGVLTGLVAVLDKAETHRWTRQQGQDLQVAFKALGVPCPFAFSDVKPGDPEADKPKGLMARAKDALRIKGNG